MLSQIKMMVWEDEKRILITSVLNELFKELIKINFVLKV